MTVNCLTLLNLCLREFTKLIAVHDVAIHFKQRVICDVSATRWNTISLATIALVFQ